MEKRTIYGLIHDVFPELATAEINSLPEMDSRELGSAIARQQGLVPEQVDFELLTY